MTEYYQISKFNPQKRETEGDYYYLSEWTAISDIGKPKYKNISFEDYASVETAYVNAICLILNEKRINTLFIDTLGFCYSKKDFQDFAKEGRLQNLEVDFDRDIATLRNGQALDLNLINKYLRLILRETINMLLINEKIEVAISFDYIMYVECEKLESLTIKQIEESGLFVETDKARPIFSFIDKDRNDIE